MNSYNLKEIENNLSDERVIELVTELGSDEYIDKSDCIIFKTICHNIDPSEASLKLYYYKKNKRFHCYTDCGDNFNIYELFKRRYELLGIEYNFYKDIVLKIAEGITIDFNQDFITKYEEQYTNYQYNNTVDVDIPVIDKNILNVYSFYPTIEWLNDGISEDIMKDYNIKYSIVENKIIIPHYNEYGDLIGIRGRALNEEDLVYGKYMPVQIEGKLYNHPLGYNLYGLNFVEDNIKRNRMAIVAEGEKSVMQYGTMFGQENNIVVAACGSSFHQYQLDLLVKYGAERVMIAFDKYEGDWDEQTKYYNKMMKLCSKFKNYVDIGFIYDSDNLLLPKQSPFDCGKDTFIKLFRKGVWL